MTTLSGCLGFFENNSDPPPATTVGWMAVGNHAPGSSHEIDLRLKRDGEIVHTSSHTIPEKQGRSVPGAVPECTWEAEPGEYVVSARPDDGEWVQENVTTTADGTSPDCVTVEIDYGSSAGEQSWVDPNDPLTIIVTDRCDEIGEFVGGCPEYQDWEYE